MSNQIQYHMLEMRYTAEVTYIEEVTKEGTTTVEKKLSGECKDPKCNRVVKHDETCFVDTLSPNGDLYCEDCGKCLRYRRKKATERGETDLINLDND